MRTLTCSITQTLHALASPPLSSTTTKSKLLTAISIALSLSLATAAQGSAQETDCIGPAVTSLVGLTLVIAGAGAMQKSENSGGGAGGLLLAAGGLGAFGAGGVMYLNCRAEPLSGNESLAEVRRKRTGSLGVRTWNLNQGIGGSLEVYLGQQLALEGSFSNSWQKDSSQILTKEFVARQSTAHLIWYLPKAFYLGGGPAYRVWQGSLDYFETLDEAGGYVSDRASINGRDLGVDIAIGSRFQAGNMFLGGEWAGVFFPVRREQDEDPASQLSEEAPEDLVEERDEMVAAQKKPIARYLSLVAGLFF